jgi:hypothetical protein
MIDAPRPGSLAAIFQEMQDLAQQADGLIQRRILAQSACDIHIGVRKPSNTRLIRFAFTSGTLTPDYGLPGFRALDISREEEAGSGREVITVRAAQESFNEIFTHLVEDLSGRTAHEADEPGAANVLRTRLILWQRLLQRDRTSGLSPEEQRGLYGELHVLEAFVLPALPAMATVQAWTGPQGIAQDFQFSGGVSLEVKTSLARAPHEITVNSERQLDDAGLARLYLLQCLVDAQRGAGETLPERVNSVRRCLEVDPSALGLFEDRLLEAGYLDVHEGHYRDLGYVRRSSHLYHVSADFPRLTPADLPQGVGRVTYVVAAAACKEYEVPVTVLGQHLGGTNE